MTPTAPALRIEYVDPAILKPAPYNPRRMAPEALARLVALLDAHGFVDPVIARREDRLVIGGHQRLAANAARPVPDPRVPVIFLAGLSDARAKALNVALNNPAAQGVFDLDLLPALLDEIKAADLDLERFTAFSPDELGDMKLPAAGAAGTGEAISLADRFLVPPFSVLDARQGYWQERKRAWLSLGIQSELGRRGNG